MCTVEKIQCKHCRFIALNEHGFRTHLGRSDKCLVWYEKHYPEEVEGLSLRGNKQVEAAAK